MLRHLPPTAAPVSPSDLLQGLGAGVSALDGLRNHLTAYLRVPACYLASSGRTALYLLLKGLSAHAPGRGEVLLPAYTCPSLARVILDLGLSPRLVDISGLTLEYQRDQLEAALGRQTLAVIHVHPFGLPQPVAPVVQMAHTVGAVVIEDAAQSMGARLNGVAAGSGGDFGLYSLGPGKPLSAGGGGVLSVNNERYLGLVDDWWRELPVPTGAGSAAALVRLATLSMAFQPRGWWLATRTGLHRAGDREESWGYVLRGLAPSQAAVATVLLDRLDSVNAQRRNRATRLLDGLRGLPWIHVPPPPLEADPIYLRFPVIIPREDLRAAAFELLWSRGIGVGRLYRHTLARIFPQLDGGSYPGAEAVAAGLLTLPTHHYVTDQDLAVIIGIFGELGRGVSAEISAVGVSSQ